LRFYQKPMRRLTLRAVDVVPIPAPHPEPRIGGLNAASTMRIRSSYATRTLVLTALVAWLLAAGTLFGQQKPDPLAGNSGAIKAMLRAGEITDEKQFDEFFDKYLFKQFVAPSRPYSLDALSVLRMNLKAQYFGVAKTDSEARARLNKMTLKKMTEIGKVKYDQYDAAIKYNALLVIGDLNEKEGDAKNSAKPYAESLPELIRYLSPNSKDYMKEAALIGLERFAAAGAIPRAKAIELITPLLEIVNQQTPPPNRSAEANDWIRRSAAQVLVGIGSPGPGNSVAKAFEAVVVDSDAGTMIRCEFAQDLGQLKYPATAKVDFSALANSLGHMAVDVCKQELESAKLANRAPSRRIVVYSLYSALVGLIGPAAKSGLVAAAEGSSHKAFVDKLRAGVQSLHKLLDDPKLEEDELAVELGAKLNELETVLVAKPTAKLVSDKKDKPAVPMDQQDGARAAIEPAASGSKK
jgi:hypothetical protein